jgi:CRP/FNR family transcriptional regulator, cyclic AMP receptor protein
MGAAARPATGRRTIRLLDYDPALGATLRAERRAEAHASALVPVLDVAPGIRTAAELTGGTRPPYGVLVLDGLANRTLILDGALSAQLVGPGDLLRIGDDGDDGLLATATRWTVLEPLTVALLDARFLLTVRRWPELVAALFARVAAQAERREVHRALLQLPRVEDRVHALMWLLAERWGRVTPHGVALRLRLTHELIGQLVGAKRPTVTLALKQLEEHGSVLRRGDGGWLLEHAWSTQPTAELEPATEGVGLLPDATHRAPAPTLSSEEIVADARRRIERMRRVHARMRHDVAATLAHTVALRERTASLRDRGY